MTQQLPASLPWIEKLIRFDTTSRDTNLPLINAVSQQLQDWGLAPEILPDPTGQKANLLVTIPAQDGTRAGGVLLSGHTDVVPVDGQEWDSDPFNPEIHDGRLYGRGTCDMKSFIGIVLDRIPAMQRAGLAQPIHVALSYDEEVGCLGAPALAEAVMKQGLNPTAAIVGEPTVMQVVQAHKSMNVLEYTFHGLAAHSSLTPEGVNTVEYAAELVRFVRELADKWQAEGPFDEAFPVPYTSASVNQIQGGIAVNTIPDKTVLTLEYRSLPGVDPYEIEDRITARARELELQMRREHDQASVSMRVVSRAIGLNNADGAPILELMDTLGAGLPATKVTFGTEAGIFSAAGIPTVVCGPGDIAQAHKPNEFIELSQILAGEQLVDRLIAHLAQ